MLFRSIVLGPTASGKTDFALILAKQLQAEIISADAFQVYKYMDIGTAKVSQNIQKTIPHHLIDIRYPNEPYTLYDFLSLSNSAIDILKKKEKPIIICGGTGLYINAFLYNYDLTHQPRTPDIRHHLEQQLKREGKEAFWERLNKIDPKTANCIHPNNTRRVLRSLEIHLQTKKKPSDIKRKEMHARTDCTLWGMAQEKTQLHERINTRVDNMIQNGLVEEVDALLKRGYRENCLAFQALGYKECILYLKGSLEKKEMIDLIKSKTRQFAKRQIGRAHV